MKRRDFMIVSGGTLTALGLGKFISQADKDAETDIICDNTTVGPKDHYLNGKWVTEEEYRRYQLLLTMAGIEC